MSRDMCTPNCTCAMCRPLHAIIDNLSGITPNRFLVESCINDEKAMHAQATCRLLNDLLHHYSISEDCWDNAPKISPSVTSLGSVGILRLHDAWDGATSWNQVLERLVDLLDAAENSVASGGSGHVVLVSTVSFANVLQGDLQNTISFPFCP